MEAVDLLKEAASYFAPPPSLTCSQWADRYRYVASGPFPGRWSTERTPDLKEIMDCVTDAAVEEIVVMKPTRVGATEGVINNAIGFFVHYDPCQLLYVQTSLEEGRKYSSEILTPMIEVTPVLRERVARERARKTTQTKLHKTFAGGNLAIVGAKSPKGFRMVSKRVVILDDIDGYESNKEGDVVSLAMGRAKDFWNKKIILVSNPTTEGISRIHSAFLASDQRYRHVPCPHCGEFQVLKFGGKDCDFGLKWKDGQVWYECECCHEKIYEHQKIEMNLKGVWKAEAPFTGKAGFHINPFLRAWHPWQDFVKEFLVCKGDPRKLMVFVNQWLGEVWKDNIQDRIDEDVLYARREVYAAEVPAGALIITAAVDVQDNRLECEVRGWGDGEESWGIDYKIFNGSPAEQTVWNALDEYLLRTWRHESGLLLPIKTVAIDTGGHFAAQVYLFTGPREGRGVYAVHGSNDPKADILDGPLRHNTGYSAKYQRIGSTSCKDILAGRLRIDRAGHGSMHFPMGYDMEYFRQLCGEKVIITKSGVRRWEQLPGRRNEALDLHNYNLAALRMYRPDWAALKQNMGLDDRSRLIFRYHQTAKHLDPAIAVKPSLPIIVCCDFDKNPLTWELCQTDGKKVWVFDEIAIRNADTMQMGMEILRRYGKPAAGYVVYGATQGTRTSMGKSEYAILRDLGFGRQCVRPLGAPLAERTNAINLMLENLAGEARLFYWPNCIYLKRDFEQAIWLEDKSEIDRTEFGRGNATDALGYFIEYEWPLKNVRANPARRFYK